MLTIDDAKKRDYIVRNKYIGKITDDNLIRDFKKEIELVVEDSFDSVCQQILNFQLINLTKFKDVLNNYEIKQIILDTYKK